MVISGLLWIALCFVVAAFAQKHGRSATSYFFLSFLLTPLLGLLILLIKISGSREDEPRINIAAHARKVPAPSRLKRFRISKGGDEMGEFSAVQLSKMLLDGDISLEDHYYDPLANSWFELICIEEIIGGDR